MTSHTVHYECKACGWEDTVVMCFEGETLLSEEELEALAVYWLWVHCRASGCPEPS